MTLNVSDPTRVLVAAASTAVLVIGATGDWYEPSHPWLMPVAVVCVGGAIGRWPALLLAIVPILIAVPEGTSGDPPALPAAAMAALIMLALLSLGVGISRRFTRHDPA